MQAEQQLTFGSYGFDCQTGQLWRGKQEVRLAPKVAAVLRSLLEHPGQLVTKEELFAAAWSDTIVSDAALTTCIQELRQALHDHARKPRYIETVHRRGYRFLGKVGRRQEEVASRQYSVVSSKEEASGGRRETRPLSPPPVSSLKPPAAPVVGRETELTQLHGWLAKALNGERQLVFVTGEPGIGKTTLVESFLYGLEPREQEESQIAKGKTQKAKVGAGDWELGASSSSPPAPSLKPLVPRMWLGWGRCIEHYGAGEAYLPVLEALGRLCRDETGNSVIPLLRQHAPSWLVQMPALVSPTELEELQRRTAGVTRERMLRELAEALEVITVERPLVLVLEDLHWSDVSTLDLLSMLARRQEHARLLILGSYRPVEVLTREHPLKAIKQELQLHGQCAELALDFLSEGAVEEYLAMRFSVGAGRIVSLQPLAHFVHQRTDGNPLFMVNVTNELIARGVETRHVASLPSLAEFGMRVPENLRQLIAQQITRMTPDERRILETASVVGAEFSAAAVAAGTEQSAEEVETHCDSLVRREQFLRTQGTSEWPDGTIAARYGFVHALYQEVLYEQISATRRIRLHRQIGEREEQAYGDRAREIAAELAVHFERGQDTKRAIQYLQHAGENARRRSANQEAITLLTKGLELLKTWPDTPERAEQELTLQIALGMPLILTKGAAAPEVEATYTRARDLCRQAGSSPHFFSALLGLRRFYFMQGALQTARELGEQLLTLAQNLQDPGLLARAHLMQGEILYYLGEFVQVRNHLDQGAALYDPQQHRSHVFLYGIDSKVGCLIIGALALEVLGYPGQALKRSHEALTLARELEHSFSLAFALYWASLLHQRYGEARITRERAETLVALANEQGFALYKALGIVLWGWALAEQGQGKEGIIQIREGLAALRATGAELTVPYGLTLLAEAYGKVGQTEEGLTVLAKALATVNKTEERWYEAELYRLRGELTLAQSRVQSLESGVQENQKAKEKRRKKLSVISSQLSVSSPQPLTSSTQEAEACFLKAIEVARRQQAKSLELRATMSLARLWQQQGKTKQAHKMLSEIYNWFTEGFDTKDLQEAKALLEELRH